MKSSCPSVADFDALLNGTLAPPSSTVVEEHLKECAACRQQLDARAGNFDVQFASPPADPLAPPDPVREIIRRVKVAGFSDTQLVPVSTLAKQEAQPLRLGDYEIIDELGRGGMGVVYRARQVSLHREVALKVILAGQLASPSEVRRFRVEAEAVAKLDHPHIVPIYEIGEHEGHQFFSLKLVDGHDLAQSIREGRFRPAPARGAAQNRKESETAARLMAAVARAIHHAHQRGILHRDLKPSNILLDREGQPLVTDFGLARILANEDRLTLSAATMGTPNYMSPEQAEGKTNAITIAADVWGLGAVLYEVLTGQAPFVAEMPLAVLERVVHAEVVAPNRVNPVVPRDLATICLRCLEKEPTRRFASAEALAEELERFARGEPILARRAAAAEKVWRWCRRKPALAGTIAALLAVMVAGMTGIIWQWRRAEGHALNERGERQRAESALLRAQIERAELLFAQGRVGLPLAQFAGLLRQHPTNRILAIRLASALGQRNFCLPISRLRHDREIHSARFSPDGRQVLTASDDGTARIWDASSGEVRFTLPHDGAVFQAEFVRNGAQILTVCVDRGARFWDAQTGQLQPTPLFRPGTVLGATFGPEGKRLLTHSEDGFARLWDLESLRLVVSLPHPAGVVAAAFSRDGQLLVTVGGNGLVRVWGTKNGDLQSERIRMGENVGEVQFTPDGEQLLVNNVKFYDWRKQQPVLRQLELKGQGITAAEFSPNGQALLTSLPHRGARLWDLNSGQPLTPMLDHDSAVVHVAFSPDGHKMVTSSRDNTVRVWATRNGQPLTEPLQHGTVVRSAQFSPDGGRLLTVLGEAEGGTAWIWDLRVLQPLAVTMDHGQPINSLAFSPDGKKLVTASADFTAQVWEVPTGRPVGAPLQHEGRILCAAFSADGRQVATASADGTAGVWDSATGQSRMKLRHREDRRRIEVMMVQFSTDGRRLLTASSDGAARIWNLSTGRPGEFELRHKEAVTVARFSPDGRMILTASADRTARLWDAATGRALFDQPFTHKRSVVNAVFTPDGRRVITASGDGTARVWDVETGQPTLEPVVHAGPVRQTSPHVSADGRRVLTAAGSSAEIWDIATGARTTPPLSHQGLVHAARFSPDGRFVATASEDQTVVLWDSAEGMIAGEPFRHSAPVQWLEFSPDGRWLATASQDGQARMWEVPDLPAPAPPWLPDLAEALAGTKLNPQGLSQAVPTDALLERCSRLRAMPRAEPYARWAEWLLATTSTRRLSPQSPLTLGDYVRNRALRGTPASLREAALLSPSNPPAPPQRSE